MPPRPADLVPSAEAGGFDAKSISKKHAEAAELANMAEMLGVSYAKAPLSAEKLCKTLLNRRALVPSPVLCLSGAEAPYAEAFDEV
jgi:hypothetical protein